MAKSLSLLLKIFLPLAVAAGIGGGSWYIYEETNPSILKAFSKKGYHFSPVSHKNIQVKKTFGVTTSESKLSNLLSSKDCSQKFFPGLNWVTKGFERTTNEETSNKATISEVSGFTEKDKAYACLILEIGHNPTNTFPEGLANWEVTLKRGNHGMVLIGYALDSVIDTTQSSTNEFRWVITHLKKEGQQWKLKSGIMFDESESSTNYPGQTMVVNLNNQKLYEWSLAPNARCKVRKEDNVANTSNVCVGPSKWKYFGLSTIWEESNDNTGEEVFEIVKQSFGSGTGDIWGSKNFYFGTKKNTAGDNQAGWNSAHTILPSPEEGWKNTGTSNAKYDDYLQKLYSPFKGKKGTWTETDKFCEKHKGLRTSQSNETIEKVVSFCLDKK